MFGLASLVLRVVFVALAPESRHGRSCSRSRSSRHHGWLGGLDLGGAVSRRGRRRRSERRTAPRSSCSRRSGCSTLAPTSPRLLRTVPAAFRDVGLVAIDRGRVRPGDAAHRRRRPRRAAAARAVGTAASRPVARVPVLGLSLERALLLAESMDVRGYGRGTAHRGRRACSCGAGLLLRARRRSRRGHRGVRTARAAMAARRWRRRSCWASALRRRRRRRRDSAAVPSPRSTSRSSCVAPRSIAATLLGRSRRVLRPVPARSTWPPFAGARRRSRCCSRCRRSAARRRGR